MQFKRQELKYYISPLDAEILSKTLGDILSLDSNSTNHKGYRVRSLYFDSFDDICLSSKQAGQLMRKKVRLRTYGETNHETLKFEIKYKQDALVFKESTVVSKALAQQVCTGNWSVLLEQNDPILDKIYAIFSTGLYQPKVIVEYQRLAYVYPAFNVRITFDHFLHSNINHLDLFSKHKDAMPVIIEGKQILEVKYEHYLPDFIRKLLSQIPAERQAISKYTLARRFHKLHKWEDN